MHSHFEPPAPRHLDLARTLLTEIGEGRYPVGTLLPTEAELCSAWAMSRYAVRQAIRKLSSIGVVSSQAGVGTKVISERPASRYVQSMDSLADLGRYASGTTLRLLGNRSEAVHQADARILQCAPGTKWLHLSGVRHSQDKGLPPIALVDMYVAQAYSKLPRLPRSLDKPLYTHIEARYGIKMTRVEQTFEATHLDSEQAALLEVKSGSAALQITRTYFAEKVVAEVTIGLHPADRFSYSMAFQLQSD